MPDDAGQARCAVIAEAGVNHNGELRLALELVDAAARAGADAVKFQTFTAEQLARPEVPESRYELLRGLELDEAQHRALRDRARERGIEFLSTPYDADSADLLERLGVRRYKLASGELTNSALLRHVGAKGLPVILSTGMATLDEVDEALRTLRTAGCDDVTLLHCTSAYPAPPSDCNLRAMHTLRRAFGLPVGYSDHTPGVEIACAAVALGAVVVEKHFTLDRSLPGPDHRASVEPPELASLVRSVRNVCAALGDGRKLPAPAEAEALRLARRGLVAARDLAAGSRLCSGDLVERRPAQGLPPTARERVLGRELRVPVRRGEPLEWEHLA